MTKERRTRMMNRDEMAALLKQAAGVIAAIIRLVEDEKLAGSERAIFYCERMAEACREAAALLEGGTAL